MTALPFAVMTPAPLRQVRPAGWLQNFLERQASGLTGHVAVSGYPYGFKFWGSQDDDTRGAYASWWPYEQTAYWIDGALKCGYLAGDEQVYRQALEEVDFAVRHAAPDGFIGPANLREKDRWPHAVFFRAVLAQYEISGDTRYLEALARHYRSTPHPMGWDRDVTGVEILLNLYQETGQPDLLEQALDLYRRFNRKWPRHDASIESLLSERRQTTHGVTFNEEAKLAAMLFCATGEEVYLQAAVNGFAKLDRDSLLADGLHSCSEHMGGKDARDIHETCDITDHAWALGYLLQATGDARYADRIERVTFNALPGAVTKDFRALQYFSCPNQVVAAANTNHNLNTFMRGLNWMSYRPDHEVQCCPGNVHRAMPNYIARMWMCDQRGGIVAALYGPGRLQAQAGKERVGVTIVAQTRYPFEQGVEFTIQPEKPVEFAFTVRIPAWCKRASVRVNGREVDAELRPGSFFALERTWQPGDAVRLDLPFELALEHWPRGGVSLSYGPLTLALPVTARAEVERENSTTLQRMRTLGEAYEPRPAAERADFPAWNLYPAVAWNYALCVDEDSLQSLKVEWNPACADPLDAGSPALRVRVPARRVRGWKLVHTRKAVQRGHWMENGEMHRGRRTVEGDFLYTPPLPNPDRLAGRLEEGVEEIELVPYAATLLRVTVFPQARG